MDGTLAAAKQGGRAVVSASFVTPYPPGFPILDPGQVVTEDILAYLKALDVKEIRGYVAAHGLRVFRQDALERQEAERAASSTPRPAKSRKETASR
jgi:arginine decarboxylase